MLTSGTRPGDDSNHSREKNRHWVRFPACSPGLQLQVPRDRRTFPTRIMLMAGAINLMYRLAASRSVQSLSSATRRGRGIVHDSYGDGEQAAPRHRSCGGRSGAP